MRTPLTASSILRPNNLVHNNEPDTAKQIKKIRRKWKRKQSMLSVLVYVCGNETKFTPGHENAKTLSKHW